MGNVGYKVDRGNTGWWNQESGVENCDKPEEAVSAIETLAQQASVFDGTPDAFPVRVRIEKDGENNVNAVFKMTPKSYLDFIDAADDLLLEFSGNEGETLTTDTAEMAAHGVVQETTTDGDQGPGNPESTTAPNAD